MKYQKQIINDQQVLLDGNEFRECKFVNCHILYAGIMPPVLINNEFDTCTFGFTGPAQNLINFMSAMYQGNPGFQKLAENMFDAIRKGSVQPTSH